MAKLNITWDFYIGMAAALLLLPLKWVVAWTGAVFLHEGCHILAIRLLGGRITGGSLRLSGAVLTTTPMARRNECIAAAAGPACLLFLLPFVRLLPRLSVCVFAQSIFNTLPLLPLDGGRVIGGIFQHYQRNSAFSVFQKWVLILLGVAAVYLAVRVFAGPFPILIFLFIYLRNRKFSCNQGGKGVQ